MLVLLLHDSRWYIFVGILCQNFVESSISGVLILRNFFYCLQGNNHKRVGPRGTKAHWVNPFKFVLAVKKAIISIELAQGELSPIGLIPINFLTGFKAIISRDSAQGELRSIGFILSFFHWLQGNNIKRSNPMGTKDHWVDTYQFLLLTAGKWYQESRT